MDKDRAPFRAGDIVEHGPSGECWTLVCDEEGGKVRPATGSETIAEAADCTLVEAADDDKRRYWLRQVAQSSGVRGAIAARQLSAEGSEG